MQTAIVVSRCIASGSDKAIFHFKGVYYGISIRKILILKRQDSYFEIGEDYLLYIKVLEVSSKVLVGRVFRSKALKEVLI